MLKNVNYSNFVKKCKQKIPFESLVMFFEADLDLIFLLKILIAE
jgi:hypothetical protein